MSITFNDVCDLLENVEKISCKHPRYSLEREKACVQRTISNWFHQHRDALHDPSFDGGALLSALFPHQRKDRVYGLQAPLLSKKLIKLLHFNHGQKALFEEWAEGTHGDLGVYTERAMRPWKGTFKAKPIISIERVDSILTQLAASNKFSDPATQRQRIQQFNTDIELKNILVRLDSFEAKWLVRLILRQYSTIELEEAFVYRAYHFLLPDLLLFQNNFNAAIETLRGPLRGYPPIPLPEQENAMRNEAAAQLKAVTGIKVGRPIFYKAWSFKHCFQMTGDRAWAAEVKYDGEYCEIHIDIDNAPDEIQIFSKNGKDATADRSALHEVIHDALRIGKPGCMFNKSCIVLGELVLYSDREQKILSFDKIRKHISRSGSFLGTLQDSIPHEWEHLMIVFFDVLVVDAAPVMTRCLQDRRRVLRELVQTIPGRARRSNWTLLDFRTDDGITDLKQAFAQALAQRQEGLVLKPLHTPYFTLGCRQPGYFIKLKRDYLSDMGGERDLGDFAIVGASFDSQVALKSDVKPLHWTHFYLGCLMNKVAALRLGGKPKFKIVGCLSLEKCILKAELKYLNVYGRLCQVNLDEQGNTEEFDFEHSFGYVQRMPIAFKKPLIAEILGGGYEKLQNEAFEMLRHPRLKKVHHDRSWEDAVTMQDLQRMVEEKWEILDADKLDGHARDVAILVKKYSRELYGSQTTSSECVTTPKTTPETSPETPSQTLFEKSQGATDGLAVQETQSADTPGTWTTASTTQCSTSTQGKGLKASKELRNLVREGTIDRKTASPTTDATSMAAILPTTISSTESSSSAKKRTSSGTMITPPHAKRRKFRNPLKDAGTNKHLGSFEYDSQDKTIHIYAEAGYKVKVHSD